MQRLLSVAILVLSAQSLRSQATTPPQADFSSVDAFWKVADTLMHNLEPSANLWQATLETTGYRLLDRDEWLKARLRLALMPGRQAARDSVLKTTSYDAKVIRHLQRVVTEQPLLVAFRDTLSRRDLVGVAVSRAAMLLPAGTTDQRQPPPIAFGLFGPDGYSQNGGVIVDLLWAQGVNDIQATLAHECHHYYVDVLDRLHPPSRDAPEYDLVHAFQQLRLEGVADLIDKPYPLQARNDAQEAYAAYYNVQYATAPATLRQINALLEEIARDSTRTRADGRRIWELLPNGAHMVGAYMARFIYQTFGRDSLFPGLADPIAFVKTYGNAEMARGTTPPTVTQAAQGVLDRLEQRYVH